MSKQVELDVNETGFLCNMIMQSYVATDPPRDEAGNILMPEWLYKLYAKLATINDQMMDELPKEVSIEAPLIILPDRIKRH